MKMKMKMKSAATILISSLMTSCLFLDEDEPNSKLDLASGNYECVTLNTSMGDIVLALDSVKAPITVANFLEYTNDGFYDGTIFHRVIENFMIQGGGFDANLNQKATDSPITNEADNGLLNTRGTIAMARTSEVHSATAQFFINTVDNDFLNHTAKTTAGWGYAVFGQVVNGMSVVDSIRTVDTGAAGNFTADVPVETITIETVGVISCDDVEPL